MRLVDKHVLIRVVLYLQLIHSPTCTLPQFSTQVGASYVDILIRGQTVCLALIDFGQIVFNDIRLFISPATFVVLICILVADKPLQSPLLHGGCSRGSCRLLAIRQCACLALGEVESQLRLLFGPA